MVCIDKLRITANGGAALSQQPETEVFASFWARPELYQAAIRETGNRCILLKQEVELLDLVGAYLPS